MIIASRTQFHIENSVLNVKAVVAAFNKEKALVGAFSVITNLRMELFQALVPTVTRCSVQNVINSDSIHSPSTSSPQLGGCGVAELQLPAIPPWPGGRPTTPPSDAPTPS